MNRIRDLMANVTVIPGSSLKVGYTVGQAKVDLGDGRGQIVYIEREGDGYVFWSEVLGATRMEDQLENPREFAERLWCRNRQTDMVNLTFDEQRRLVGRIDHPTQSLDADELFFYLSRLAVECDRMEYLLTGENKF